MSWINAMRNLQKNVYDYTQDTIPQEGLLAVLTARTLNTTIQETDLQIQQGKKRQLKINYYAPDCDVVSDSDTINVCQAGDVQEPKQMWFEISRATTTKAKSLNKNDIRNDDGNFMFSDHAKFQIRSGLAEARKSLAQDVIDLLAANVGLLPNGEASQLLPMINKSDGTINPMGVWNIERAYRDSGYQNPFIVGGTDVFYWKKAVSIGGINDKGQNLAQMGRTNAYYDTLVNTSFGDNATEHVISFDPQMIKFVSFNNNAGMFATDMKSIDDLDAIYQRGGTDYIEGVMQDPVTGLLWDLYIKYDFCNSRWTWQYQLLWDMFFLPPYLCGKQGVNGIFHWTTCVPLVETCSAGSPLPANTASTFSFDTNGNISFPYIVQTLNIAGIEVKPNQSVANLDALIALMNNSAPAPLVFTKSGTEIRYSGFAGITVTLNGSDELAFT